MTLSDARTRLRARVGNPDTTSVPNSELTEVLNDARQEVADKFRFHATRGFADVTTVAGTLAYNLPTTFTTLLSVQNYDSRRPLRSVSADRRSGLLAQYTDNGVPRWFYRNGATVELIPRPQSAHTVRLYGKIDLTAMSADGDAFGTPSTWDRGIILLARSIYYSNRQDYSKSQYALNEFKIWVSDKPDEVDEESAVAGASVEIPDLGGWNSPEYDFDHSE